jgi:hypothetical protein
MAGNWLAARHTEMAADRIPDAANELFTRQDAATVGMNEIARRQAVRVPRCTATTRIAMRCTQPTCTGKRSGCSTGSPNRSAAWLIPASAW